MKFWCCLFSLLKQHVHNIFNILCNHCNLFSSMHSVILAIFTSLSNRYHCLLYPCSRQKFYSLPPLPGSCSHYSPLSVSYYECIQTGFIFSWCAYCTYHNVCKVYLHCSMSEFLSFFKTNTPHLWVERLRKTSNIDLWPPYLHTLTCTWKRINISFFLFSHSSISRHLCCFCLWDAVNYTSVNGDYKCLPQSSLLILLGSYPEVGFLNHKLILCWTFLKIHVIVYQPAFILKGGGHCCLYLIETYPDLGLKAYKFWPCISLQHC